MKNKGYTVCPVYVEPLKYLEGEWYEKVFQTKIVWNGGGGRNISWSCVFNLIIIIINM